MKSYKQIDENKNHPSFPFMDFFRRNRKKISKVASFLLVAFFFVLLLVVPNCAHAEVNPVLWAIKKLLGALLSLVGWLLIIPGIMLDVLLKVENNALYLDSTAVREVWVMVRDFLNLFFIFTLLFSAFATIFQIEKYHIKKIIFKIIIMALLVNFSFPIARFFIDVSNVAMYWMLNNMFGGSGGGSITVTLAASSGLKDLLTPANATDYDIAYLIAAIIFTFIFGITLMMIAILFLVRLIALSVVVMFSPIGFVGYVFPDTAKYASQWWDTLLKYSFFAPVMTFGLAVTLKMMQSLGANSASMSSFRTAAENNSANVGADANWIAAAAFFIVPIVILWLFMGVAQKFSIAGASAVQKKGQDIAKWAGGKASGISFAKNAYKAYESRRGQANADKLSHRLGTWAGGKPDQLWGAMGDKRAGQRYQSGLSAQVADAAKLHDMPNKTENELRTVVQRGNKFDQAAAMMELAARGRTDKTKELDQVREKFGENSQVFRQMQNKVKAYDPASAFAYIKDDKERQERIKEHVNSNQFDAKKLNADALENAEFLGIAMENGSIKPGDLNDLAKKSATHAGNIKSSLEIIANQDKIDANGNVMHDAAGNAIKKYADTTDENHRNIHMAYMASTGRIHRSLDTADQRKEIFSRLDKDNAKSLLDTEIAGYHSEIMQNINIGKFKEVVANLKSDDAKRAFVQSVKNMTPGDPRRVAMERQIRKDALLVGFW